MSHTAQPLRSMAPRGFRVYPVEPRPGGFPRRRTPRRRALTAGLPFLASMIGSFIAILNSKSPWPVPSSHIEGESATGVRQRRLDFYVLSHRRDRGDSADRLP